MTHLYCLVGGEDGEASLSIYPEGAPPIVVDSTHPAFDELLDAAQSDTTPEELAELADSSVKVGAYLNPLSERVAVSDGHVFFDGDPVHSSITEQVIRFLEEGVDDWRPLVRFLEKLYQNPQEHSREQLYEWLKRHGFTIAEDGDFIAYKGVMKDEDGTLVSQYRGNAIVDGVAVRGHVPNRLGSTVEIPRSEVEFNPSVGCSTGLHAGTYKYAHSYASGALLEVRVNPRDVVSVPTDSDAQKLRVSRYTVKSIIDAPETAVVVFDDDECDNPYYCADCADDGYDRWP